MGLAEGTTALRHALLRSRSRISPASIKNGLEAELSIGLETRHAATLYELDGQVNGGASGLELRPHHPKVPLSRVKYPLTRLEDKPSIHQGQANAIRVDIGRPSVVQITLSL